LDFPSVLRLFNINDATIPYSLIKKELMMLKKAFIPLMVAGLIFGAHAGDYDMEANPSKVFLGIQLSGAWVQGTHKTDLNYATSGLGYGVRLGAQNAEWRSFLSADKFNNDKVSYERGELHVDYLFTFPQLTEFGLHPFIGMNGGYANYEAEGGINENGFTYGGELGVVFDLNDQIDIDVSYQYSLSHSDAFDHVGNLGIGINYKY
jgi:opacity protein-like surface antigen